MKRFWLFFFALALGRSAVLFGQTAEEALIQARNAASTGSRTALKDYQKALSLAEKEKGSDLHYQILREAAGFQLSEGAFAEAEKNLGKALGYRPDDGLAMGDLALVFLQQARYDTALALMERAVEVGRKSLGTAHPEFLNLLNQQALAVYKTGDYRKAERIYRLGINQLLNLRMSRTTDFANWLNNLGLLYENLSRYDDAMQQYRKAEKLMIELTGEKSEETAYLWNNLGLLYAKTGQFEESERLLKQSLRILRGKVQQATVLGNQAKSAYLQGHFNKADDLYTQSLKLKKEWYGDQHPTVATTLKGIAEMKTDLADYPAAARLLLEVVRIEEKVYGKSHPVTRSTYLQISEAYLKSGDLENSQKWLKMAKSSAAKLRTDQLQYVTLNLLDAEIDLMKGDAAAAITILDKLLSTSQLPEVLGKLYFTRARAYVSQNKWKEAAADHLATIESFKRVRGEDHPDIARSRIELAIDLENLGDHVSAAKEMSAALKSYSAQIETFFPFMTETEKIRFFYSISEDFAIFNSFVAVHGKELPGLGNDLINFRLLTKALLLNSNARWKTRIRNSGDLNLIARFADWQVKREQFMQWARLSENELTARGIDLAKEEVALEATEKELMQLSGNFGSLKSDLISISWENISNKLKENEVALECIRYSAYDFSKRVFSTTSRYIFVVLTPKADHPQLVEMPDSPLFEERFLKSYRNSIAYKQLDQISYGAFWKPLEPFLKGAGTIFISPDGVYNLINPLTLYDPTRQQYLSSLHSVKQLTNLRELISEEESSMTGNMALLVGNPDFGLDLPDLPDPVQRSEVAPLPGTEEEVRNLQFLLEDLEWKVTILTEEEATEGNLRQAYRPRLLHVATHGFFDKKSEKIPMGDNPLVHSGLLLAGAEKGMGLPYPDPDPENEDGLLTAAEAMALNVDNTDLVVLSACETGLGKIENGEGVFGLQRSLKVAGASTLIMSLWKIDDQATQELMTEFYENWFEGMEKYEAFLTAQESVREKYPEPYYWGAFVYVGR